MSKTKNILTLSLYVLFTQHVFAISFAKEEKIRNNILFKNCPSYQEELIQKINNEELHKFITITTETDTLKKKKMLAMLCSFPFPLGVVGAHRVLLGTKPWVPIVYVATVGGCFGILPLLDFILISTSKDISKYENHSGIFIWVR